jgi:hypothetical protein
MTTNLGAKIIEEKANIKPKEKQPKNKIKLSVSYKGSGIGRNESDWEPEKDKPKDPKFVDDLNTLVNDALKAFFKPEFINRIDEIIVFDHLTKHNIWQISRLMVKQLKTLLKEKDLILKLHPNVYALLAEEGYDPIYGARPLRRTIMSLLEDELAERCLSETLYPNTKIVVKRKTLATLKNEIEQSKKESLSSKTNTNKFQLFNEEKDIEEMTPTEKLNSDDLEHNFTTELDEKKPDTEVFTNKLEIEIDKSGVDKKLLAEGERIAALKASIPKKPTDPDKALSEDLHRQIARLSKTKKQNV